jgi:tetratricopeptide (TPR) repeat protein
MNDRIDSMYGRGFMKYKNRIAKTLSFIFVSCLVLAASVSVFAQTAKENDKELAQAMEFARQNRHVDALPLLEKAALRYPADGEVQASLGVSILANSTTIKDEEQRRKEVARGAEILRKAKKLGTENILALHFLDKLEAGMDIGVGFNASSKEVEDAIREGEGFFGRGEYDKAFLAYERAYKLDPKSYDAALFAGDCFFGQKRYKEADVWFARAAAIDQNREQALRFWGDSLLGQNKPAEALAKFAEAIIAESDSRLAWNSFWETVKNQGIRTVPPFIVAPGSENSDTLEIVIDAKLLKAEDGTINWNRYTETRRQQIAKFNTVANGRKFEPTVSEDTEALKSVAAGVSAGLKEKKIVKLHQGLENLAKLNELGLTDIYVLMFLHDGNSSDEFEGFRAKNRDRMRRFFLEYLAELKP